MCPIRTIIRLPVDSTLKQVEAHAAKVIGGKWRACDGAADCWRSKTDPAFMSWILEEVPNDTN